MLGLLVCPFAVETLLNLHLLTRLPEVWLREMARRVFVFCKEILEIDFLFRHFKYSNSK